MPGTWASARFNQRPLNAASIHRSHDTRACRHWRGKRRGACTGVAGPCGRIGRGFTVGNIRVEGLQRISEGTVFNYLPINIGDRLDRRRIDEALKAIYATGFFRDVQLRRDGGTLVVFVQERPSIESFDIKGNKDIKTEDLQRSLNNVGLAPGKTFDQSVLDDVNRYMTEQYFSRGKYAVKIDSKVEEVPGNRVRIAIDIVEGARARIRQINVVGNTTYPDDELLDAFKLKEPNLLSFYKQDDRYSKESLTGDLETLRSYYMDRGFADFRIDSTQVAIAPEKDDMFVTVNVHGGRALQGVRGQARGQHGRARGRPQAADLHQAGRDVFPPADHADAPRP